MLRVEKLDADTLTLVSDDANAENLAVQDAAEGMEFPVLASMWQDAEMDDEGQVRMDVKFEQWGELRDLLGGVDAPDAADCEEAVVTALKERDEAAA